uniref:RING-type domain-containing protein n=1 Tax=Steinernema glaseri TaxID=37863 RepID=A0A1I8A1C4_9BILA
MSSLNNTLNTLATYIARAVSEEITISSDEEYDNQLDYEYTNVQLAEVTDDDDFDNVQTPRMTLGTILRHNANDDDDFDNVQSPRMTLGYDWRTANTAVVRPRQRRGRRGRTVATTTESRTSVARRDSAEIQGRLTRSRKRQMECAKASMPSSTAPGEPEPSKKLRIANSVCPPVAELTAEDKLKEKESELQKVNDRLESNRLSTEKALSCAICMGILHRPMGLSPCAHKFCSSCMSMLLKEKLTRTHPCHSCPQCRMEMYALTKDASTNEHVENYYATFPDQKPSAKELEKRDEGDKILAICRQSNGTIVLPPQRRGSNKLPLRAP